MSSSGGGFVPLPQTSDFLENSIGSSEWAKSFRDRQKQLMREQVERAMRATTGPRTQHWSSQNQQGSDGGWRKNHQPWSSSSQHQRKGRNYPPPPLPPRTWNSDGGDVSGMAVVVPPPGREDLLEEDEDGDRDEEEGDNNNGNKKWYGAKSIASAIWNHWMKGRHVREPQRRTPRVLFVKEADVEVTIGFSRLPLVKGEIPERVWTAEVSAPKRLRAAAVVAAAEVALATLPEPTPAELDEDARWWDERNDEVPWQGGVAVVFGNEDPRNLPKEFSVRDWFWESLDRRLFAIVRRSFSPSSEQ